MNAKLEAEILNVREDLFNQISTMKSSKDENDKLILEIHKEKVNFELSISCRDILVPSGPEGPNESQHFPAGPCSPFIKFFLLCFLMKKVLSPPALAECRRSRGSITS